MKERKKIEPPLIYLRCYLLLNIRETTVTLCSVRVFFYPKVVHFRRLLLLLFYPDAVRNGRSCAQRLRAFTGFKGRALSPTEPLTDQELIEGLLVGILQRINCN